MKKDNRQKSGVRQVLVFLALLLFVSLPASANAQTPTPAQLEAAARDTGRARTLAEQLTPEQRQLLDRIRASGLTRDQMRQRLRDAGYDPTLVDRYYDAISRSDSTTQGPSRLSRLTQPLPTPSSNLLSAMRRIGILTTGDSLREGSLLPPRDSLARARVADRRKSTTPQVFGRELFAATTQFEPQMTGPVDPDYRLGPGDELTLIVTGDVEIAYDLQVTREGYIVVPDIGQVVVNGLTLDAARQRLNERLARVYSGIQAGSTDVDISVGRVRTKQVYVIGEVEVPGGYQLAGSATVFSALYRAGGPADKGTFRRIEVRRGGRIIREVDLYDYLLRGDKGSDIRLEHGDVVFVPVVGTQVTMIGSVRRPAIYEARPPESLVDVLRFAGGAEADAALERVQIDRILPPESREPGRERVLVDVSLAEMRSGRPVRIEDGDRVRVSKVSEERRNRLVASGDVRRPGEYEYQPGMTALTLIDAAQGLQTTAYRPAAHIIRLNRADSSTILVRVSLSDPAAADYAGRMQLEDLDELVVFGRVTLSNPKRVEIFGHVKNEGTYAFSEGMSVDDLVLLAGGFREGAEATRAEVARRVPLAGQSSDTVARIETIVMDLMMDGRAQTSNSPRTVLRDGDQVFIRKQAGFEPLATVEISGEVQYPGAYTVESRREHLSAILIRAGGLTRQGYAAGARLFRGGHPVAVDLPKALRQPRGAEDLIVEPGDRIEVPVYDPTVLIVGAVAFESRVRWEQGLSVPDYLERAGGVRPEGSTSRVSVRFPNGALKTTKRTFGVRTFPKVEPGSTITVPLRPEGTGFNWEQFMTRTLTIMSTIATLMLAIRAAN